MASTSTTGATSTASAAIQNTVYQLMATDRLPLQRLQSQKSDLDNRTKEYQTLGSKLSSLLTRTRSFALAGSQNPLRAIAVTGGDDAAFSVTTDGSAQRGTHTIEVLNIATRHAIASSQVATADPVSTGKSTAAEHVHFRITAGGAMHEYTVELEGGLTRGQAIARIAAAINDEGGSVTAAVVSQGNGFARLVVQSGTTGEAARITDVEDIESKWMASLGLAGKETHGSQLRSTVQTAADAHLKFDGIDVSSAENAVRNLAPGVSLEIQATSPAVSIRVEQDADSVVKSVQQFITDYNAAVDEVRGLTQAADETGQNRGLFAGDVSVSRLRTALREAVALPVSTTNSLRTLSEVGVTTDRSGHLELSDEKKFRAMLESSPQKAENLWAGTGGVASRLVKLLDGFGPTGTTYANQLKSWKTQGRFLDDRMKQENAKLARRQETLTSQMAQMQSTVALLVSQQNYLSGLLSSSDSLFA